MKGRLRRQLRQLQLAVTALFLIVLFLAAAALTSARAQSRTQSLDELTVQRINVVDANGTLRMVISNKDRQHPGVIDGKVPNRQRPDAGLLFFNDVGDEVGGLTYNGQPKDGHGQSDIGLNFDQWKQDQTIGVGYAEDGGQRSAALRVWDRSETQSLGEIVERMNAAEAITDPTARAAAIQTVTRSFDAGHVRLFVGKTEQRASVVDLRDAKGQPRLRLKVEADGAASIEFLDAAGKVTKRFPE